MKVNKDVLYNINNEFIWLKGHKGWGMCAIAPTYGYRLPQLTSMYTYLDRGEAFVFIGGVKRPISDYYDETSVDKGLLMSLLMAATSPFSCSHVEIIPGIYKDYDNYFYTDDTWRFLGEFKRFLTHGGESSLDTALRDNYPFIVTFPRAYIKTFLEYCDLSKPEKYGIGIDIVDSIQQFGKKYEWRG